MQTLEIKIPKFGEALKPLVRLDLPTAVSKTPSNFTYVIRLRKGPRKFPMYLGFLGLVAYRKDAIQRTGHPAESADFLKKLVLKHCKIPNLNPKDFCVVRL